MAERAVVLVRHASSLLHETGPHPERVDRLRVVSEAIERSKIPVEAIDARAATREDILRCHTEAHYRRIEATAGRRGFIDSDTVYSAETFQAALHAAGSGPAALDHLRRTRGRAAFAAVRPPGHHATADRAMGFCFFNNVAICARYARAVCKIEKVLIVDWDVHHGNGTQAIFYEDPSVFYYSLHLWPHYPGTGREEETGAGAGAGTTLNRPLPHRYPAKHYLETFRRDTADIFKRFDPALILVSAGFDSHRDDPLGGLDLDEDSFEKLGAALRACAGDRPIISLLDGGYNLACLGTSVVAHLKGIA